MIATSSASLLLLLLILAAVSGQLPVQLEVRELRQVRQPGDPSGLGQNVRVVLKDHTKVGSAGKWELTLFRNVSGILNQVSYDCSTADEDQIIIDCEGKLRNAYALLLLVLDEAYNVIAIENLEAKITDFGSRAAWVGDSSGGGQAFLRVHTGTLDKVEVDGVEGNLTCSPNITTCYYQQAQVSGQPEDMTVSRCKEVDTDKSTTIQHCDDVVGLFPPLSEDPEFELFLGESSQQLTITHGTDANTLELVEELADDEVDFQTCKDVNNACSFDVALQEDQKTLQRTLVFLNFKNYVTNALNFDMEVYKISMQQVTTNSLGAEWDDASPGRYLVTVAEAPRDSTTQIVECNGTPCHTYFTSIALGPSVKISVKKEEENKTVTFNQELDDPPPSSTLLQMIRVVMDSVVTVVNVSGSTIMDPATATVVLVRSRTQLTFNVDDVMDWQGDLVPTTVGYSAQFDMDLLDKTGRFDFLVVAYKANGQVDSAASATLEITVKDIDLKVDLVGSGGEYIRVSTPSNVELSVNSEVAGSCNIVPCYVPMLPQPWIGVSVCTTTPPLPSPALCQYTDPSPPPGMAISPQVQLLKGSECEDSVRVTFYCDAATMSMEVYLVDLLEPQMCSDPTVPCMISVNACLPGNFDVLVTGIGIADEVVETATVSIRASPETNSGVILVSVLAAVFGTIFIIFFIIIIIKKKQSKQRLRRTVAPLISSGNRSVGDIGSDPRDTISLTTWPPSHIYQQPQNIQPYRAY